MYCLSTPQKFSPGVACLALFLDSHTAKIKVLAGLNCFMAAPRINVLLISLDMWAEFDFIGTGPPSLACCHPELFSASPGPATWFLSHGSFFHLQSRWGQVTVPLTLGVSGLSAASYFVCRLSLPSFLLLKAWGML